MNRARSPAFHPAALASIAWRIAVSAGTGAAAVAVAVAVAVDGVWTPAAEAGGEPTYAPRSAEDLAKIDALVKAAIGFNEERGDVVQVENTRFSRDTSAVGGTEAGNPLLNFTKNDLMRGVELLVLLITGLLLIFFVLRPLLKTASTGGLPAMAGGPQVTSLQTTLVGGQPVMVGGGQLAGPSEMEQRLDIARIEGQVKASSVKKVADFVDAHPDESTTILRGWVHET